MVAARSFVAARVMHRLAMEFRSVSGRSFTASRQRSMITLAKVEIVIDVTVKMIGPVIPGPGADEDTARKPLRTIVAIRGAIIGRRLVISIRANRSAPEAYRNMRRAASHHKQDAQTKS